MEPGLAHFSVMTQEVGDYLLGNRDARPAGAYCDCTAGAGGHARHVLERAPDRKLIAMDRDRAAVERCRSRLGDFGVRVAYFQGAFSRIREAASECLPLAGIMADLGLSRPQLDEPDRGFSLRSRGPLDMRFDRSQELCAEDLVNRGGETDLADLLYRLADERFSRRIARAIVRSRPIRDTLHLADTVASAVPRRVRGRIHPATKTFQALRMAVNDEQGELARLLEQAPCLLAPGGRFVVLSFHSGEDRAVKLSFRRHASSGVYTLLTRRPVRPSAAEVVRNPPSRSARLRAVCRTRRRVEDT